MHLEPATPAPARESGRLTALGVGALTVFCASLTITAITNNDIWIHIKTGDLILQNLALPGTDPYSFTAAEHEYFTHEWLSAVVFSLVYAAGGVPGLIFFKFFLVLTTWLLLFFATRASGDRLTVVLPPFGILGYVAAQRYLERPHMFTFVFTAAYMFLIARYRYAGRHRAWLWAIVPLHVLWVNLHSGFFLGIMVLGAFAVGELLASVRADLTGARSHDVLPGRDVIFLLCLPALCLAASLINPYGYRLLLFPFRLTGMEIFMQTVFEWKPPLDAAFVYTYMFTGYAIWLVLLGASFVACYWGSFRSLRDRVTDGLALAILVFFTFAIFRHQSWLTRWAWAWLAIATMYCLLKIDRIDLVAVALAAGALGVAFRHNRSVGDALTVTLPVLTRHLSLAIDRLERSALGRSDFWKRVKPNAVAVTVACVLLLCEALHIQVYGYWYSPVEKRESGIRIAGNMPLCAVDYVERRGLTGNAFTSYTTAALLIHRRYPHVKVNMDSRNEVYGPELFREYSETRRSPQAMEAYLRKYRVDFFLIRRRDFNRAVIAHLLRGGEWVQVFFDDENVVLVPRERADPKLIEEDGYQAALPGALPTDDVPPTQAEAFLREADRTLRQCPTAGLALWYRAQALVHLNRPDEALVAGRELVRLKPEAWYAWQLLGGIYEWTQDKPAAIEAYRKALQFNPRYLPAGEGLKRLGAG